MKEIINDLKEIRTWLKKWFYYRRHAIKLKLAISLADIKQRAFNKRYYIMLMELPQGDRLVSINNDEFTSCKRKGWLPKTMKQIDLQNVALYQTPLNLNNTAKREEKEKAKEKYMKYLKKMKQ